MNIFRTEVSPKIALSTDQVVSAAVDPMATMYLPGLRKTSEKDVVNVKPGAVRRTLEKS
jgi:hypothetical protein